MEYTLLDIVLENIDTNDYFKCPNKECKERGNYLKCIYDKHPDCKEHIEYGRNSLYESTN